MAGTVPAQGGFVLPRAARVRTLSSNGNHYEVSDYLGDYEERTVGPQAFLVALLTPEGVIRPHFHHVDQYQVVVGGSGTLAPATPLMPGGILYTDRYTSYGPITAGAQGISFFTVRVASDVGAHYMPDSRVEKRGHPSGERFVGMVDQDIRAPVQTTGITRLEATHGGAEAYEITAAPGDHLPIPAHLTDGITDGITDGRKGFHLMLAGSANILGTDVPAQSIRYVSEAPELPMGVAGPTGAAVLLLLFPSRGQA